MNKSINQIIKDITIQKENMVYKAFELCGFDKEYLYNHISEFSIMYDQNYDEQYYHNEKHLFTLKRSYDAITISTNMYIVFMI